MTRPKPPTRFARRSLPLVRRACVCHRASSLLYHRPIAPSILTKSLPSLLTLLRFPQNRNHSAKEELILSRCLPPVFAEGTPTILLRTLVEKKLVTPRSRTLALTRFTNKLTSRPRLCKTMRASYRLHQQLLSGHSTSLLPRTRDLQSRRTRRGSEPEVIALSTHTPRCTPGASTRPSYFRFLQILETRKLLPRTGGPMMERWSPDRWN